MEKSVTFPCGKAAKLEYDHQVVQEAINCGWESMAFPEECSFAQIRYENNLITLKSEGEICMVDRMSGKALCSGEDDEEIRRLALSGEIYDKSKWDVLSNNMLVIEREGNFPEANFFDERPEDLVDFEKTLICVASSLMAA